MPLLDAHATGVDAAALPFAPDRFDQLYGMEIVQYGDLASLLAEFARVTRPGEASF